MHCHALWFRGKSYLHTSSHPYVLYLQSSIPSFFHDHSFQRGKDASSDRHNGTKSAGDACVVCPNHEGAIGTPSHSARSGAC